MLYKYVYMYNKNSEQKLNQFKTVLFSVAQKKN